MSEDFEDFQIVRCDGSSSTHNWRAIHNAPIYDTERVRDLDKAVTFFDKPLGHYLMDPKPPRTPKSPADTNMVNSRALHIDNGREEGFVDVEVAGVKSKLHLPAISPVSVVDSSVNFYGEKIHIDVIAEDKADSKAAWQGVFRMIVSDRVQIECPCKLLRDDKKNQTKFIQAVSRRPILSIRYCERFYAQIRFSESAEIRQPVIIRVVLTGTLMSPL